ncbi:MAG: hypothetical protein KC620_12390 [Myxococcales bacterium]|nr:hypothetical protein [Myxococcales bacterium]
MRPFDEPEPRRPAHRGGLRALCLVAGLAAGLTLAGCGGYASTSEAFRQSLTAGDPQVALTRVNEALEVPAAEQLPSNPKEDTPLLLLERATILQALGENKLSARDFQTADKNLDVLDLTGDTTGEISKYLFSDDATIYKAPPHEKLLLNTMNMINYLVMGDPSGARVEARRMLVNRKYLEKEEGEARSMMALGSYLSGFVFEVSGEPGPAMRHYGDAHDAGGVPTLAEAVGRLAARSGSSDPRLAELTENPPALAEDDAKRGELLVVVQTGMAPFLLPERLPIGAAVVAASSPGPGARLSRDEQQRANVFAAKGVLKWVNYPRLQRVALPSAPVDVDVDGQSPAGGVALDVASKVNAQYEQVKGTLIAASITRLITRAVAGELTQAATRSASNNGLAGLLVGLAVEGAMTAADTPDTRSWVTLPAAFHIARARLPAGAHTVRVRYRGRTRTAQVNLAEGGFAVVNFSDYR